MSRRSGRSTGPAYVNKLHRADPVLLVLDFCRLLIHIKIDSHMKGISEEYVLTQSFGEEIPTGKVKYHQLFNKYG